MPRRCDRASRRALTRRRPLRRALAAAVASLALIPVAVRAHGGSAIDKDPCVQKSGEWSVHFTVYEPDLDPSAEYCADVPKAGAMIVVFDLVDLEMRKVPLDIAIVRGDGATREVVHHVAAKAYPSGVINAEVTLPSPGRYVAIVTPEGRAPVTFPLRVEMETSILVWIVPLFLLAPALYYWSQRRSTAGAATPKRGLALVK